jgi:hypothetical protein
MLNWATYRTVKKNTKALLDVSKEVGRCKFWENWLYGYVSRTECRKYRITQATKKALANVSNQNCLYKERKSKYFERCILSFCPELFFFFFLYSLRNNIENKIWGPVTFCEFVWMQNWCSALREGKILDVFDSLLLRKIFVPKREEERDMVRRIMRRLRFCTPHRLLQFQWSNREGKYGWRTLFVWNRKWMRRCFCGTTWRKHLEELGVDVRVIKKYEMNSVS